MTANGNLFLYSSQKQKGVYCYSLDANGGGLPATLSPWWAVGVMRPDQKPPHGLSRENIESGVRENGYQLWRKKLPPTA